MLYGTGEHGGGKGNGDKKHCCFHWEHNYELKLGLKQQYYVYGTIKGNISNFWIMFSYSFLFFLKCMKCLNYIFSFFLIFLEIKISLLPLLPLPPPHPIPWFYITHVIYNCMLFLNSVPTCRSYYAVLISESISNDIISFIKHMHSI